MKHVLTIGIAGVLAGVLASVLASVPVSVLGGCWQTACVVWAEPLLGEYFPLAIGATHIKRDKMLLARRATGLNLVS